MLKKNAPFLEKEAKELFVFGNDRPRGDGIGVGRSAGRSCDRLLSLRPRLHSRFFYGFLFGGLNGRTVDGGRNRGACVGRGLLLLGRLISRLLLFFLFLLLLESLDRLRRLAPAKEETPAKEEAPAKEAPAAENKPAEKEPAPAVPAVWPAHAVCRLVLREPLPAV